MWQLDSNVCVCVCVCVCVVKNAIREKQAELSALSASITERTICANSTQMCVCGCVGVWVCGCGRERERECMRVCMYMCICTM